MKDAMHKVKRERELESQWIKRKQQDLFRGSSTQLYIPAFTEKDFQSTNCPPRTPTEGTSTEDLGQYNNWEYRTPLSTNTTTIHLYRRGIQANTNLHLTKRE